ncbi:hypothetical protein IEQ34_022124 [Dendrobium chrysotoxum]|uniref:RING-type E3 ubiquitin transferase n=1 Tax=Dendrobium chrysotoxum TaxID=161865 RepID=A0AAV7FY27_DENCH|nr:hypothetical protein IEQ34_022124 [Dendrobium chrysotoxum]
MSSSSAPQSSNSNAGGQWFPVNKAQSSSAAGASLMLSAILSLIFVVLVISIHIYTRYRRQYESNGLITIIHSRTPPTRPAAAAAAVSKGLDAAAIEKLPTFPYRRPENGGSAAECAVCLSVAEEGEMVRMLPECKHLFHVGCIDMWLYSHSTCPVCRGEAKVLVTKFVFGDMVAAPRLPERVGGSGSGAVEAREGSSESRMTWVMMVDGERDLERQ